MPGSLEAAVGFAAEHWVTTTGLLALGVLAYWYFAARSESDAGAANTASAFMERAERGFGDTFGALTSILIGLLAIGVTIASELLHLGVAVNGLIGEAPVLVGHFVFGVFAWAGLAGYIPLDAATAGWVFLAVTVVAVVMKYTDAAEDWREVAR